MSPSEAPTVLPTDVPTGLPTEVPRRAWVEQVMGMPVSVHVRGPKATQGGSTQGGSTQVPEAVAAVFAELHAVDALFSTYRPSSQVSRLRRGELAIARADPLVREVVELCTLARERTHGWFDADRLPGPDGRLGFDPTGLVKGWAVERASRHLAAVAEHDFLIDAGGDVVVGCRRTDTPDWRVGIEDPADRGRWLATVPLRVGAVATSGTAARGTHILDPASGRPADALRSVTVVGPSLLWADVYATAAFARGPSCPAWLATLPDHLGFVVGPDGATTTVHGTTVHGTTVHGTTTARGTSPGAVR